MCDKLPSLQGESCSMCPNCTFHQAIFSMTMVLLVEHPVHHDYRDYSPKRVESAKALQPCVRPAGSILQHHCPTQPLALRSRRSVPSPLPSRSRTRRRVRRATSAGSKSAARRAGTPPVKVRSRDRPPRDRQVGWRFGGLEEWTGVKGSTGGTSRSFFFEFGSMVPICRKQK